MKLKCSNLLFLSMMIMGYTAQAKVVLPSVFSDNMVFQQKTNAAIWGKAEAGKLVNISTTWSKKQYTATADRNGNWKVMLATPAYGGPYEVTISDGEVLNLKNVLIGEVWICSGQSNMEMPLAGWGQIKDHEKEIAAARYPNIRLLQVPHQTSTTESEEVKVANGGWQPCSPETVAEFSSVAYFFAREIYQKKGIPVGLIHTSWGGTLAESWMSGRTLEQRPDFAAAVTEIRNYAKSGKSYPKELAEWQKRVEQNDPGYVQGKAVWSETATDDATWQEMALPALFDETVLPGFDGVVWFRKKITIPAAWAGKALKLNLGTIDDNDLTFFNGEKIGETQGYNSPRQYVIPAEKVKAGTYVIAVRVFDGTGGGGIYGPKGVLSISAPNGEKISLDGNWKYRVGFDLKNVAPMPFSTDNPNRPTVLYNQMLYPFRQFAIRGAIWYQGESNADRAHQYRTLFPELIKDWRALWNQGDFPFYFVQLAGFQKTGAQPEASAWAELRDAQFKALALPNTGMAVAIDIGEEYDIHPKNKQEVGHRLALIALARNYGEKTSYSGPVLQTQKIAGDQISLTFKFADGGLKAQGGTPLTGFAIAGKDGKFHWATAGIKGNTVTLTSPEVPSPVAVRYAWGNYPVCNLYNGAGLPASPFRTDEWPDSTEGKK